MTDRELLEFAAKAAGLEEHGWMADTYCHVVNNQLVFFDPLTDDGDALRLAVKLGLFMLKIVREIPRAEYEKDPYAATRRAIVRSAAAIGKAMP